MSVSGSDMTERIREVLLANGGSMDQDRLIEQIDGEEGLVLSELRSLLSSGRLSYNRQFEIDGRGKSYATGLLEEQ